MKRTQKLKIQAIQKEQVQLVQIETTLETLLAEIKDSINTMKVEELQLKSSLVEHFTNPHCEEERPTTSAKAAAADVASSSSSLLWLNEQQQVPDAVESTDGFIDESINRQLLDLETLLVPMKKRVYSDDEEDDELDDEVEVYNDDDYNVDEEEDDDDEEFLPVSQ